MAESRNRPPVASQVLLPQCSGWSAFRGRDRERTQHTLRQASPSQEGIRIAQHVRGSKVTDTARAASAPARETGTCVRQNVSLSESVLSAMPALSQTHRSAAHTFVLSSSSLAFLILPHRTCSHTPIQSATRQQSPRPPLLRAATILLAFCLSITTTLPSLRQRERLGCRRTARTPLAGDHELILLCVIGVELSRQSLSSLIFARSACAARAVAQGRLHQRRRRESNLTLGVRAVPAQMSAQAMLRTWPRTSCSSPLRASAPSSSHTPSGSPHHPSLVGRPVVQRRS